MFIKEDADYKTDSNGLRFTAEKTFGDFVYSYIKQSGAATTGDIIEYVKNNYPLLEGDLVKTSETRSSYRYRQTIDNLIKCHGSILNMFHDLKDFPGGLAMKHIAVSEDLLSKGLSLLKSNSLKALEAKALADKEIEKQALKIKQDHENYILARNNSKLWRVDILNNIKKSNDINLNDVVEDFDDIVKDVAYRHSDALNDKELFIKAFINECA